MADKEKQIPSEQSRIKEIEQYIFDDSETARVCANSSKNVLGSILVQLKVNEFRTKYPNKDTDALPIAFEQSVFLTHDVPLFFFNEVTRRSSPVLDRNNEPILAQQVLVKSGSGSTFGVVLSGDFAGLLLDIKARSRENVEDAYRARTLTPRDVIADGMVISRIWNDEPIFLETRPYKPIAFARDLSYNALRFKEVYSSELANSLGNTASRVAKMAANAGYRSQERSEPQWLPQVREALSETFDIRSGITVIMEKVAVLEKLIADEKPWTLSVEEVTPLLKKYISELQTIAWNLRPYLPETAEKILEHFLASEIKPLSPIFPRLQ